MEAAKESLWGSLKEIDSAVGLESEREGEWERQRGTGRETRWVENWEEQWGPLKEAEWD